MIRLNEQFASSINLQENDFVQQFMKEITNHERKKEFASNEIIYFSHKSFSKLCKLEKKEFNHLLAEIFFKNSEKCKYIEINVSGVYIDISKQKVVDTLGKLLAVFNKFKRVRKCYLYL